MQAVFGFKRLALPRVGQKPIRYWSVCTTLCTTCSRCILTFSIYEYDNWVGLLPLVQLAHNTTHNQTLEETPHYIIFGRRASLPIDVILGVPSARSSPYRLDYSRRTVEKLQLGYKLARRNAKEHSDRQAGSKEESFCPQVKPGGQVRVRRLTLLL